jgi:large subunit ribosomal protein L4
VQLPVYSIQGEAVSQIDVRDDVFGVDFNEAVVHQAMVAQLANQRQGTVDTKNRRDVSGSTKKLYAQKHTGRARRGDIKSPLLKGGGIAFGPHPRSYRQAMPKKMRRLALRCLLSAKAKSGEIKVVDQYSFDEPKTKDVFDMLVALGIANTALIATDDNREALIRSARNLAGIKTVPARLLNVVDLLSYRTIILSTDGVRKIEQLWGKRLAETKDAALG